VAEQVRVGVVTICSVKTGNGRTIPVAGHVEAEEPSAVVRAWRPSLPLE
jgi:hypothetical protein